MTPGDTYDDPFVPSARGLCGDGDPGAPDARGFGGGGDFTIGTGPVRIDQDGNATTRYTEAGGQDVSYGDGGGTGGGGVDGGTP